MFIKTVLKKLLAPIRWASSIYFNFRYLPFKQAIKLPIFLRKPRFLRLKGKIIIDCPKEQIKFMMIRLGSRSPEEPDLGIRLSIYGTIIFKGNCCIGCNSCLNVGEKGILIFGNNFGNSQGLVLNCFHRIEFKENVLVGFGTLIMDSDMHAMQKVAATSGGGCPRITVFEWG